MTILYEKSRVLVNYTREWELLRGIYNNKFNEISRKSQDQEVIDNLWEYCYVSLKKGIWIPRCEEVARLEHCRGIVPGDKKKKKEDVQKKVTENNKNKKQKNKNKKDKNNNKNNKINTKEDLLV